MKILNIINPHHTDKDKQAWQTLIYCISSGFEYDQTKEWLEEDGIYIPEDQFDALNKALDIMVGLDIGERQEEWK